MKLSRTEILKKYSGRCAYCGNKLTWETMRISRIDRDKPESFDNCSPACRRCVKIKNEWNTDNIEIFRNKIELSMKYLRESSPMFRLAEDFGQVRETGNPVQFWFEREQI